MNRRKSLGFNLVELMIALVLALLLGAIGLAVFMGSKQGFRIVQGLAETQDGGRAVLGYLRSEVAMAGYPGININVDALVSGLAAEGGADPDVLGVEYESPTDCRGQQASLHADGKRYSRSLYRIQGGALVCVTLDEADTELAVTTLLPNVADLQVLYGEDVNTADELGSPDRFVTADRVSDWTKVTAVELGVLVSSTNSAYTPDGAQDFSLLNQRAYAAADDGRVRVPFQTVVPIRNRQN